MEDHHRAVTRVVRKENHVRKNIGHARCDAYRSGNHPAYKIACQNSGSRVVLLHVADGWAARTFAENAISAEIQEDEAYLKKICDEFLKAEIPTEAELAVRRTGEGNYQVGRGEPLRSGGDEYARASSRG